jgi:hypothetical protein
MSRSLAGKLLLSGILSIAATVSLPATAQAVTAGPVAGTHMTDTAGHHVAAEPFQTFEWIFSGVTYPNTSAGASDCQAEGEFLVGYDPDTWAGYRCLLNNPDAGVINLWLLEVIGCRYCVKGPHPELSARDPSTR